MLGEIVGGLSPHLASDGFHLSTTLYPDVSASSVFDPPWHITLAEVLELVFVTVQLFELE